jgi:pilus assembly protein CpaE
VTASDEKVVLQGSRRSELRVGILCINLDTGSRESLEVMVAQAPGAYVVGNVDRHITAREAMRMLEPFQQRIAVVDFDGNVEENGRIAQRLRDGCDNSMIVFAAASDPNPETIIAAMRCGCTEYLLKPFQLDRILDALAQLDLRRQSKVQVQKGRVITLMGAKGGTGVTSLALHLALNLVRRHQQKCLLVDEHPALGDVSLCLGLGRNQYSFYELVHNTDRLDVDLLQGFLSQHASGLDVLDSPEAIHAFPHASAEAIEHTLAFLSENYQFVIIDTPPGMSEDTCAAIRQSDRLAMVITPELPAIRNAVRSIEYLTSLHYPDDSIDIVLNRYSRRNALTEREIEAALHREIALRIPNNYGLIINAINAGVPLDVSTKSEIPLAFDLWADRLIGGEAAAAKPSDGSRGWLGLFGS